MTEDGASPERPIDILLVDDRVEELLALEVALEGPGLRLVKARSGPEALRCLLQGDFAVILLDVAMPGMDGFEVTRLIKQSRRSRHVPIILLTAESHHVESMEHGYALGAADYILKPLSPAVVRAKVSVFVELHRRGEEIRRQADLLQATERRRAATELAELQGATERRYRNLADAIPQLVWTAQPDGGATYFNLRWIEYTGLSLERSIGLGWQSVLHPSDVQRFVAEWKRALSARGPLRVHCRLRGAGGGYRFHLCEVLPERGAGGELVGWLGTFTDVNEQKQLEEDRARLLFREQMARAEAELSLRRLEILAEASHLLTRTLDVRDNLGHLAELVTTRLASWCVIDLLGEDGSVEQAAFAHEDAALAPLGKEIAERRRPLGGALGGGRAEVSAPPSDPVALAAALGIARLELVSRLGAEAYVSTPLSAHGRVLGALTLVSARRERRYGPADVALAADLAQRAALAVDNARLYARAQEAVRLRDEFLSIASHELRTPLSALQLQAQAIRVQIGKRPADLDRIDAKAVIVERQVGRLLRLINEMLDVSRIEAGRLDLTRSEVDLAELCRDVAARFADELARAGSTLASSLAPGVVGIWDRSRLDQVVSNLIHNAIRYGRGGPISMTLAVEGAEAILRVGDRGIGIAPADQARIFERFARAVSPQQYGGMGVGLFIVDQILKAHGGRIDVASALGEGSTFTVRLPMAREAAVT
jgi:PAS domain S-box-containing protein